VESVFAGAQQISITPITVNRQLQAEPPVTFRMGVMKCSQTRLDDSEDIDIFALIQYSQKAIGFYEDRRRSHVVT